MKDLELRRGELPAGQPGEKPAATSIGGDWGVWAWLAIPVFLTLIALLWVEGSEKVYEASDLRMGLTFVSMTLMSLCVAYLAARIFLVHGRLAPLMFGCGSLFWAFAGVAVMTVGMGNLNLSVTIHNTCAGLSAFCHLLAVTLSLRSKRTCRRPELWLLSGYAGSLGIAALVMLSAVWRWTPLFFVQGEGGTPVRQLLLVAASVVFVLTATTLVLTTRHRLSGFRAWYAAGLALIGTGLVGVMLQPAAGTALSWAGRAAQYLGATYLLVAAVVSAREFRAWGVPVEEALRESEERYRGLFENMSEGFAVHEIICNDHGEPCDYRFLEVNPAFERLTGLKREAVVGRRVSEVLPQTEPEWATTYGKVALTGEPVHFERLSAPLGRYYEVFAYRCAPGQFACVFLNITERKEAEEELRRSEALYRAIGESIDYGVWVCAPDGRNIYASDSFLKLVGQTQEQCSNFGWSEVLHPEDAERTIAAWKECIRTEGTWDIEHRFRGVDGQWHDILARGVPVRDEKGQIVRWAGINLDISRLKRTEQALHEAQARLQAHADELEKIVARRTARLQETISELEHFSYAITHDLRAPLRAMQGFAEMIDEEFAAGDQPLSRQYLRRIKTASSRMDQLISDSLSYSKASRQELPLGEIDLNELLVGMVETYPNLQPEKADIRIEPGLPLVLGNEAALTQCFSNLLGNAVKFVQPGLKPQIRVWGEPAEDRWPIQTPALAAPSQELPATPSSQPALTPNPPPPPAMARIWVEDNGIGIPENYRERIFGIFQRGSNEYEGTGIGLAIVRKVVQRMGGRVGVESEMGRGSRFWVELPVPRPFP